MAALEKNIIDCPNIHNSIENELQEFRAFFRQEFVSLEPILGDVTEYILSAEGKLLRPAIILLSAKLNGTISKKTYLVATAIETLHTATLVHDDVVDDAELRRGMPSVQYQFSPRVAVLAGDYLLAKALEIITNNNIGEMLPLLTNVVKILSEGELFQLHKASTLDTTEEDYLKIIYKKTASLICACTHVGAWSVDANAENIETMIEVGRNIGYAFQIRDDIFDYEKNNGSGKPYGNDLKENKLTLPIIFALQNTDEPTRETIKKKIRNCEKNPQYVDEIIDFVRAQKGIEYAEQKMKMYSETAISLLEKFPDCDARAELIELAKYIAVRKK